MFDAPNCPDKGNTSLVFEAFNAGAGAQGSSTQMLIIPYDLTGLTGASINFDVAMRKNYFGGVRNRLRVFVSTDCGQNFVPVYDKEDAFTNNIEDLHTVGPPAMEPTSSWVPSSCDDWREDVADLSAFVDQEILVGFLFNSNYTSTENLYLDNICIKECDGFADITPTNGPEICLGDTAVLQANTGPGFSYQWYRNGIALPNQTTETFDTTIAGAYQVRIVQDGCAWLSEPFDVIVRNNPNPQVIGDVVVCVGDTATIDAGDGYSNYLWSNGDTTQVIMTPVIGTYTVTVTNEFGCTGTDLTQVSNLSTPSVTIGGMFDFCVGDSSTINVSPFFTDVQWNTGSIDNSITVLDPGFYSVTVTGSNGCSGRDTVEVIENPLPMPEISGVTAICSGQSAELDAGDGYIGYKWNVGPVNQILTVTSTGTYYVTVTDQNGCKGVDSITVVENAQPIPEITGDLTFCAVDGNLLDAGGGYDQYLWSNGDTTQNVTVFASGTYMVTVTTAAGCTGTDELSVTAFPSPDPDIQGDLAFCEGESGVLNAGFGFTTYAWNDGSDEQTTTVTTGVESTSSP